MKQDTNVQEAFPVETRVTYYGGLQLAIHNLTVVFSFEWGNQQHRMYPLSLKMRL